MFDPFDKSFGPYTRKEVMDLLDAPYGMAGKAIAKMKNNTAANTVTRKVSVSQIFVKQDIAKLTSTVDVTVSVKGLRSASTIATRVMEAALTKARQEKDNLTWTESKSEINPTGPCWVANILG